MTRLSSVTVSYTTWAPKAFHSAEYILDTFSIVRRHDVVAFGTCRTKVKLLAFDNALTAGDTPPPTSPS